MTDKCRAPNMCKLAREWIRYFSIFAWLSEIPSEMLFRVVENMGYKVVGKDLVDNVCLQHGDVYITLPVDACYDFKPMEDILDNMTEVMFSHGSVIMRVYFNKQITLDLGDFIKAYVSKIEIEPYVSGGGYFRLFIPVNKEKDRITNVFLVYCMHADGFIHGHEAIIPDEPHKEMLSYIIEDILDDRYEELNTILKDAYKVIGSIERETRQFLKQLSKSLGYSLKCREPR